MMSDRKLKELGDGRVTIQLKYGSDFTETEKLIFDKMRNTRQITRKIIRVMEFMAAMFDYDLEDITIENLNSAADYYLFSGAYKILRNVLGGRRDA